MKGQAILISYALATLLSVILIVFSSLVFFSFYSNWLKNQAKNELESVSLRMYNYIVTAYDFAKKSELSPKNNSCVLLQEVSLNLPSKISGKNYELLIKNSEENLEIESRVDSEIFAKKFPKVEVEIEGKLESEKEMIMRYSRCNLNNEIKDKIVFGGRD
ncbi:MAG: hypothetical protein QXQ69_02635 [Candidatus Aenigmatarchaeota archaeon]